MRRIRLRLSLLTLSNPLRPAGFCRGAGLGKVPGGFDRVCQALVQLVPALAEGRGTLDPNEGNGSGTATASPDPADQGDGRSAIDPNGNG
jgi:hypothetical protein